jgi:hypothetical protein
VLSALSARGRLAKLPEATCSAIAEHQVTHPLSIPDTIAVGFGARALEQLQYPVEDRSMARTARDRPLERIALDRCQFVAVSAPG